jgi:hypothetical protein
LLCSVSPREVTLVPIFIASSDLPISPSDLPWWGWLFCATGAGIICAVSKWIADDYDSCLAELVAIVSGLAALVLAIIGIVGFIKWIWET